jgi:ketosteroid isomerase-like protein
MMSAHDVVAAYWAAAEARDWAAFGELLADDVLYRGPQASPQNEGGYLGNARLTAGAAWRVPVAGRICQRFAALFIMS